MHLRRLGDDVGHRPAIAEADLEHVAARSHTEQRDNPCIARAVGLIQPFRDRETDSALRVAELPGPLRRCERFEDGHRRVPFAVA